LRHPGSEVHSLLLCIESTAGSYAEDTPDLTQIVQTNSENEGNFDYSNKINTTH
jgi:hypothetical protein